jgi:tRNA(Phe) wybutosine-synthesizing methylase Tyw3
MKKKRKQLDEKAEKDSTSKIPAPWDPQEIEHLVRNRKKMSNDELEEFLRKDHELQEELQAREWTDFSRWEERFLIQNHKNMTPEEVGEELDREERVVELKMRTMGLKPSEP